VRYSHFGEGSYEAQEQMIRQLLEEAKAHNGKGVSGA